MVEFENTIMYNPYNHGGVYREFGIASRIAYWAIGRSIYLCKMSSYGGELRG